MGVISLLRLLCSLRHWEKIDADLVGAEPGPGRHHLLSLSGFREAEPT